MYVAKVDLDILREGVATKKMRQYREKFGEPFICFNYADFPGTKDKRAAEMYLETLEKALQDDKPYHIVSHRYDTIDH